MASILSCRKNALTEANGPLGPYRSTRRPLLCGPRKLLTLFYLFYMVHMVHTKYIYIHMTRARLGKDSRDSVDLWTKTSKSLRVNNSAVQGVWTSLDHLDRNVWTTKGWL